MFWGLIMESGKRYSQTVERAFHVSMACLEPSTADNENVSVMLVFDKREFILCNLHKHKAIQSHLDLNFQSGDKIAFLSSGKGRVHLTGYLLETDEDEDDEDMDNMMQESSILESGSFSEPSSSVKDSGKRKTEQAGKSEFKKAKLEAENQAVSSSDDEDDEDDDDFALSQDSDEMLDGNNDDDEDEDDDDEDEEDDDEDSEDEDESDDEIQQMLQGKSNTSAKKKKDKQSPKLSTESPQNKNKSPNEKQKNKSLIEKQQQQQQQQKNKTPNQKQQQQKNKTPNEKQGGNTPNQKTPGNQINGVSQQQEQSGKKNKKGFDTPKGGKSPGAETPGKRVLQGGVVVEDVKVGNGPVAKPGRQVVVHYVGRLKANNKQFDSATEGPGFKFRLGRGEVIKGWDIGVSGMKVGGKRKIVCPAPLAYGNKGSPPAIPPNSTLVFDVELKAVN